MENQTKLADLHNSGGNLHCPYFVYKSDKTNRQTMEQATEHPPKSLVYEMVSGKPIYYQGYKGYLDGKKQMDEIIGSSKLQALIVAELIYLLRSFFGETPYPLLRLNL